MVRSSRFPPVASIIKIDTYTCILMFNSYTVNAFVTRKTCHQVRSFELITMREIRGSPRDVLPPKVAENDYAFLKGHGRIVGNKLLAILSIHR